MAALALLAEAVTGAVSEFGATFAAGVMAVAVEVAASASAESLIELTNGRPMNGRTG
jgi:hypothetical protein